MEVVETTAQSEVLCNMPVLVKRRMIVWKRQISEDSVQYLEETYSKIQYVHFGTYLNITEQMKSEDNNGNTINLT